MFVLVLAVCIFWVVLPQSVKKLKLAIAVRGNTRPSHFCHLHSGFEEVLNFISYVKHKGEE